MIDAAERHSLYTLLPTPHSLRISEIPADLRSGRYAADRPPRAAPAPLPTPYTPLPPPSTPSARVRARNCRTSSSPLVAVRSAPTVGTRVSGSRLIAAP